MTLKLFRARQGLLVECDRRYYLLGGVAWDDLVNQAPLARALSERVEGVTPLAPTAFDSMSFLPPIGSQEVWACGVTYLRSREARMAESKEMGSGDFYARVYEAERPEIFFKATPHRVAGMGQKVRIRKDSRWNVPEPELTLLVSAQGSIQGYTIGNDMSSRDIEGENPLYLPQAKIYDQSCALGPGILVTEEPLPKETAIVLEVRRGGSTAFRGSTALVQMKRRPEELVRFLFLECSFPRGCFLMTGTGVVPPEGFTLASGDQIRITIEPIGTLVNTVM